MLRPLLTDARKDLIVGLVAGAFFGTLGVLAAAWIVAAFAVGSVELAQWIGGKV